MSTRTVVTRTCLSALILWGAALPSSAQISARDVAPVTGPALETLFSGTTMDGIYKRPRERSGTNTFTETFNTDGTTDYVEGKIKDTGTWRIINDVICFKYDGALAGGYSCFQVFKSGTCYYSYAPGNVRDGAPVDPNRWSVKTILRGDVSTCDNLMVS